MSVKKITFKFKNISEKDYNALLWHFYYDIIGEDMKNHHIDAELYSHKEFIDEKYLSNQVIKPFDTADNNTYKFGE